MALNNDEKEYIKYQIQIYTALFQTLAGFFIGTGVSLVTYATNNKELDGIYVAHILFMTLSFGLFVVVWIKTDIDSHKLR